MLPTLVLLSVYNLCFTQANSFQTERRDGIIGNDLLLELLNRMDAKDEEINELRGMQKLQAADINTLKMQIHAQEDTIKELTKQLNENNMIAQHQKLQDAHCNTLQQTVDKLQFENVRLKKSYSNCAREMKSFHVLMKNFIKTNKNSQHFSQGNTSSFKEDDATANGNIVGRSLNKSKSAITSTYKGRYEIGEKQTVRRQSGEATVAFFATLTNSLQHLGVDQKLKFDNVITNIGSAYNHLVGAFFAPVSGTYVFMSTLLSYYGHSNQFRFVRNGALVCKMRISADTTAGSFVLHLEKGDVVAMENVDSGEAVYGDHYSFFSGFLLKEM